MQTHYFTFRKFVDGQPQDIYIEVVVRRDIRRKDARRVAEQELNELREWKVVEPPAATFPDYRFVGAN